MRDRFFLGITLPTIDTLVLLKCSGLPSCQSILILWIWQLFFATSCFLSQSKRIAAKNCGERFELDRRPSCRDQRHDLHKVLSRPILTFYIYYYHHEYHHPYLFILDQLQSPWWIWIIIHQNGFWASLVPSGTCGRRVLQSNRKLVQDYDQWSW